MTNPNGNPAEPSETRSRGLSRRTRQALKPGLVSTRAMFNAALEMRARGLTVYDLSLGNPELEPPQLWKDVVRGLVDGGERGRHRYMNNSGFPEVRKFVAERESAIYGVQFASSDVTMTVGAAGGLNVAFRAVLESGRRDPDACAFFYRISELHRQSRCEVGSRAHA
ncbi:MAG: hypothetical protein QM784_05295 [Polyangiaceae bacterium]